jgi:hypothetical protein
MAIFIRRKRAAYRFEHVGELKPPAGFDQLISVSVGLDGPAALWADAAALADIEARTESPGFATFPETRTSSRPGAALTAYWRGSLAPAHTVIMNHLPVAHPLVQSLPNGEFLVVGARCAWRPEGPERNALLVAVDGTIKHEGTLGDGIEHMLVDTNGEIWVGYFDEGIFGNFGWGNPGPEPLGSRGIVRWSVEFDKVWEYTAAHDYELADCYALNVDTDRVWACPYTDFPIIEIESDRATVRATRNVSGPRGLLVAGEHVALLGDYANEGSLLIGQLSDLSRLKKRELGMPDGRGVPPAPLTCRGSVADLFVGTDWFTFDLAQTL